LRDQGLVVDVFEEANAVVAAGLVIRQFPLAGEQVVTGATVSIWVSTGPEAPAPPPEPEPEPEPEPSPGPGNSGGGGGGGGD
jgi:hypothetical protein